MCHPCVCSYTYAADYINLEVGIPKRSGQVPQKVEYPRIVFVNLACPVVPQIAIQAGQGFLIVTFAIAIDDIQALSGMGVKQVQAVDIVRNGLHFWLGRSSAEQAAGEDHRQHKNTAQIS